MSAEDVLGAESPEDAGEKREDDAAVTPPPPVALPPWIGMVRAAFSRWGRWVLLVIGALAVVMLVRGVGAEQVWLALTTAAPWLPLILVLDMAVFAMDAVAIRLLVGPTAAQVPVRAWIRSSALAYAIMIFLPAGRAGGEVARATVLSRHVGGARAAAAAAKLQAAVLLANFVASIPAAIAVATVVGAGNPLALLILANGIGTLVLGALVIWAARGAHPDSWIARKLLPAHAGAAFHRAVRTMPTVPLRALACCTAGRAFQAIQYGIILLAVGGSFTVQSALVAHGIHLVGAGLGDFVPNQVGITEGAYGLFAPVLGLSAARGTSVAIALVARVAQFILAAAGALLASVVIREPARKLEV